MLKVQVLGVSRGRLPRVGDVTPGSKCYSILITPEKPEQDNGRFLALPATQDEALAIAEFLSVREAVLTGLRPARDSGSASEQNPDTASGQASGQNPESSELGFNLNYDQDEDPLSLILLHAFGAECAALTLQSAMPDEGYLAFLTLITEKGDKLLAVSPSEGVLLALRCGAEIWAEDSILKTDSPRKNASKNTPSPDMAESLSPRLDPKARLISAKVIPGFSTDAIPGQESGLVASTRFTAKAGQIKTSPTQNNSDSAQAISPTMRISLVRTGEDDRLEILEQLELSSDMLPQSVRDLVGELAEKHAPLDPKDKNSDDYWLKLLKRLSPETNRKM